MAGTTGIRVGKGDGRKSPLCTISNSTDEKREEKESWRFYSRRRERSLAAFRLGTLSFRSQKSLDFVRKVPKFGVEMSQYNGDAEKLCRQSREKEKRREDGEESGLYLSMAICDKQRGKS